MLDACTIKGDGKLIFCESEMDVAISDSSCAQIQRKVTQTLRALETLGLATEPDSIVYELSEQCPESHTLNCGAGLNSLYLYDSTLVELDSTAQEEMCTLWK